jgi:DNA helicase-2/ATP-dependent DNA helicase PcrA
VERLNLFGFVDAALRWFSEQEKRLADLHDEGFVDYHAELASWNDLQKAAIGKYGRDQLTLNVLLQEFDLSEKTPPVLSDAVRCLTIHSAKGMEFDHVYLAGLVDEQLPSYQSIKKGENSREMQEERRNCFVAITRTQKTLTITYSEEYFGWPKKPSRFLYEMELLEVK